MSSIYGDTVNNKYFKVVPRYKRRNYMKFFKSLLLTISLSSVLTTAIAANVCADLSVAKNYKKAVPACTKQANEGDNEAQYNLALIYHHGEGVLQDYKQASYWYKKAAEQGLAEAQYNLASLYYYGEGVLQDYKQASYWYKKAAEQGVAEAQYNLALRYDSGNKGVLQDYNQAIYWLKKAAKQGLAKAQVVFGFSYVRGRGVITDDVEAYVWWNVAAAQGKEAAGKYRDLIAKKMTPAQIAKAQELSKVYFQKYVK
jgi:TPR repeat protein